MTNWTYNELRFKSEDDCKKVAKLMKSKDSDFDFNNIIPMPTYLNSIPGFGTREHTRALAYAFSKGEKITEREMEDAIKQAYPQIKNVADTLPLDALLFAASREPYVLSRNDIIILTRIADTTDYKTDIARYQPFNTNAPKTYAEYAELVKRAIFETGCLNWYSWSVDHWGSKWNASDVNVDINGKRIYWQTAWSPTPNIVAAIHEKTNIPMYYIFTEEQITAFAGEMIFKDGKVKIHNVDDPTECFQLAVFMETVDQSSCRMTADEDFVYEDEDEWDSAKEITAKATLEQEFLSI